MKGISMEKSENSSENSIEKPNLFQYTNPLQFLIDVYSYRKNLDPKFNIKKWAQEMGLEKPSLLALILNAKRPLQGRFLSFLSRGLELNATQSRYLSMLIIRKRLKDSEERSTLDFALEQMRAPNLWSEDVTLTEDDSIFSSWLNMAVFCSSKLPGVRLEPKSLKPLLKFEVSESEIAEAIATLKKQNLIQEKPVKRLSSKNDKPNLTAQRYFSQVLGLSQKAIGFPVKDREFQSFAFVANEKTFEIVREFVRELRTRISTIESSDPNSVYQAQFQVFPLLNEL